MIELFSSDFSNKIWAKKASELAINEVPFKENEVIDALRQYAIRPAELLSINSNSEAITAFNGKRTTQPPQDFLVSDSDLTIKDYISRLDKLAGDREWAVMYYGLYAATPAMWDVAKNFADELALSLGYRPGGRVDIDCFIGRYTSTHIGVHIDHAHNFGFTLKDGKTMFTWPGYRTDLIGLTHPEYESFKSESIALSNSTDRVAYFPQDALHVAETKCDVSVNINIAFWETANDSQSTIEHIKKILQLPNSTKQILKGSGISGLTPDNQYQFSTLESIITDGSLKQRMLVSQLILDTSSRLGIGRPLVNVSEVNDIIALRPSATMQWIPIPEKKEILVAANGHCAKFEISDPLINLLVQLSTGKEVDISSLSRTQSNSTDVEMIRVVAALASWGSF